MAKTQSAGAAAAADVTQETLDATPGRAVKFLQGVGTVPEIRAALAEVGYSDADHQEGWSLVHAASGYEASGSSFQTTTDPKVRAAIVAIDSWDEDGFRIVRAALTHRHPAQAAAVLAGIGPSTGAEAVVGAKTLLTRIDALGKSKNKDDHAALATLEARGLTKEKRAELLSLVKVAEQGAAPAKANPSASKTASDAAAKHQAALVQLRVWFEEWSEMARATIKRRDRLIRLGLANRKSPKRATPPAAGAAPTNGASNGSPSPTVPTPS